MHSETSTELGKDRELSVFCRAPVPGATKTRLTPPLDSVQAAALSAAMLLDTVEIIEGMGLSAVLYAADRADVAALRGLVTHCQVEVQTQGDLGERLMHAVTESLSRADAVAIVGSDCPTLSSHHLHGAFAALDDGADAAVCPSADGGYGLIALARPCPELFAGIPWSTPGVLTATRAAAGAAGLSLAEIEPLDDVDRPEDLVGLAGRLAALGRAPRTRHLLHAQGIDLVPA